MEALSGAIALLRCSNRFVLAACEWLTVGLLAAITAIVCAGVLWRYGLNDALSWSEETAKFLMVWMVFAASPIALAKGSHAAIEVLPDHLPPRARYGLFVLIHAAVVAFVYVLVAQGYGFALNARVQTTPTTGISMMYIFAAMPVGGVLLGAVALQQLLENFRAMLDPSQPPSGPRLDDPAPASAD